MSSTNMSTTRSNSRAIPAAPQHNCLIPNGAASDTSCYYEAEDLVNYTGGGGEASLKSAHRLSELANNDYNTGYSASSFYPCQKFSLQNGDHQIHVINPPPNSYYWEIRESKFRKNKASIIIALSPVWVHIPFTHTVFPKLIQVFFLEIPSCE